MEPTITDPAPTDPSWMARPDDTAAEANRRNRRPMTEQDRRKARAKGKAARKARKANRR